MGMAASQARFLGLTSRKADIECETQRLSNQKMSLARDMQKVSSDYQNALSSKVLKWSSNAGASYVDLSYNNLMRPSSMNQNNPYIITDTEGKVVIDNQYKKYAEMISPDGSPNGDWDSVRTQVLSELTGVSPSTINAMGTMKHNVETNNAKLKALKDSEPQRTRIAEHGISDLLEMMGKGTGVSGLKFSDSDDWQEAYEFEDTIELGKDNKAGDNLAKLMDHLKGTLSQYFPDNKEELERLFDDKKEQFVNMINKGNVTNEDKSTVLSKDGKKIHVNVKALLDQVFGAFSGEYNLSNHDNSKQYTWYDVNSTEYKNWQADHDKWQKEYDAALAEYNSSVDTQGSLLDADSERKIAFYDKIFSSIAEKGWTYNCEVSDTNYLNQMLQNNAYMITTVERSEEYDAADGSYDWDNEYQVNIASNFDKIVTVNDSEAANEALAEYEYKKSVINSKETRIDTRMTNLSTELSAINQMLQGLESVIGKNVENNFGVFG